MARHFTNTSTDYILSTGVAAVAAPVTLACWGKIENLFISNMTLLQLGTQATSVSTSTIYAFALEFNISSGVMANSQVDGVPIRVNYGTPVVSSVWFHCAGVFLTGSGTDAINVYFNGSRQSASAGGFPDIADIPRGGTLIGAVGFEGTIYGETVLGSVADAAVWNVQLVDAEIAALAQGVRPYNIRPQSLIAYFPLDGLQSPEPDLSGYVHNGILTGTSQATYAPPMTLFTPKMFIPSPSVTVSVTIPSISMIGTNFSRKISYVGY